MARFRPGSWWNDETLGAPHWLLVAAGGVIAASRAGLRPARADVFLVMTGTNDLRWHVPFESTAAHLAGMAAKVGATRVVLLAIPPRERETTPTSAEFNARLRGLAARSGWTYYDGLAFVRAPGGGYVDAFTTDGVHLTPEAERRFGRNVLGLLRG